MKDELKVLSKNIIPRHLVAELPYYCYNTMLKTSAITCKGLILNPTIS